MQATTDDNLDAAAGVDPNAEFWQQLLAELRAPDFADIREQVRELAKSQVVSDRWSFRTFGSRSERPLPDGHPREHRSVLQVDEYGVVLGAKSRSRWLERRGSAFSFLGSVVDAVDVIKAVILTRQRQVLPFLRPERDQGPYGFRISRVDGEKPTPDEERETRRIETMLLNGGDEADPVQRQRLLRPELVDFVKLLTWDTLVYDACPIELTYTRAGTLSGWHNVDPKTVRLCSEQGYEGNDEIRAVQVIDEQPEVVYGYRDLLYPVRNPRSDLHVGGYGYAEPEMVVRALTHYLNAVTYNAAGLDRNAIPRGLLTLFGDYQQRNLDNFTRQMKAMVQGAANRWTVPILASKSEKAGAIWTPIDQNFQEMFFARWMTFLVSIVCAIYGVDPTEIHFDSFSTRPSSLSGSDTAEKLSLARDKGLVPLLAWLESVLTRLVRLMNPLYRFEVVGLHDDGSRRNRSASSSSRRSTRCGKRTGSRRTPTRRWARRRPTRRSCRCTCCSSNRSCSSRWPRRAWGPTASRGNRGNRQTRTISKTRWGSTSPTRKTRGAVRTTCRKATTCTRWSSARRARCARPTISSW